jgi:hypothetical protein
MKDQLHENNRRLAKSRKRERSVYQEATESDVDSECTFERQQAKQPIWLLSSSDSDSDSDPEHEVEVEEVKGVWKGMEGGRRRSF